MAALALNGLNKYLKTADVFAFQVALTQPGFTCSKLTIETLEQGVKYAQKLSITTPEQRQ